MRERASVHGTWPDSLVRGSGRTAGHTAGVPDSSGLPGLALGTLAPCPLVRRVLAVSNALLERAPDVGAQRRRVQSTLADALADAARARGALTNEEGRGARGEWQARTCAAAGLNFE